MACRRALQQLLMYGPRKPAACRRALRGRGAWTAYRSRAGAAGRRCQRRAGATAVGCSKGRGSCCAPLRRSAAGRDERVSLGSRPSHSGGYRARILRCCGQVCGAALSHHCFEAALSHHCFEAALSHDCFEAALSHHCFEAPLSAAVDVSTSVL